MSDSAAPAPKTLYRWQRDALDAWAGHGHRGIVEAVTGAGKTELGIRAVAMRLQTGGVAAVVVPTRELMYHWARGLRRELAMVELGLLGDGRRDTLRRRDVLVATVPSARSRRWSLRGRPGVLVADECHRMAGEANRLALDGEFEWRLGLSAVHARPDGAHETVLGTAPGGAL